MTQRQKKQSPFKKLRSYQNLKLKCFKRHHQEIKKTKPIEWEKSFAHHISI